MSTLKRLHRQAKSRRSGRPAFTLLELIVVLLVLGILAAIAVPTFNRVKENSVSGGGGGGGSSSTTSTTVASFVPTVGATGPGGGIVFYVDLAGFACGPTLAATCTYLEAAPNDISGYVAPQYSPTETTGFMVWCSDTTTFLGVTATAIGTGMANTTTADATCTSGAIQAAADYSNNGYSDWYLPSLNELIELSAQESTVGGFDLTDPRYGVYWSSTEVGNGSDNDEYAKNRYFHVGEMTFISLKNDALQVRPIRAG